MKTDSMFLKGISRVKSHRQTFPYNSGFVLFFLLYRFSPVRAGGPCGASDFLGASNPSSFSRRLDSNSGQQYLMTDNEYVTDCCGYVSQWEIYAGATGAITFQVWRATSGNSYSLVGENSFTVSSTGDNSFTVPSSDLVYIEDNDIIGWYTGGTDIVMYRDGGSRNDNNYIETIAQPSVGDVVSFTNRETDQTYAIKTVLSSVTPTFSNLDASLTFLKSDLTASSLVYNVTLAASVTVGSSTMAIQSVTPASSDFSIDANTGDITTLNAITAATIYTIVVRATDPCGNTVDGTLTVEIINRTPVIGSLPAVAQISESAVDESLLHAVNVTDPDGDAVTCTLSMSPSGPFITKFITSGGTLYNGVYLQASPNLDYSSVNSYELTVTCIDTSSASDSGIIYVYITQNKVPVISNLQNSTNIFSNLSTSSIIFSILASDAEGDQMSFTLTCITLVSLCPFAVYSDGSVLLAISLLGSSINAYEVDISVADALTSSGTHRLTVFVLDLNVAPILTNLPDSIQVTEDTSIGTVVFDTSVYDDNGDTSFTFTVNFNPSSSAALFSINSSNGEITVANNLNYLTQSNNYTLTIQVSDGQTTSSSSTLQVETVDVNQAPVLYQTDYKVEASEGNAGTEFPDPGYNVYDPDADTLIYSLSGGDETAGFNINSTNGVITFSIEQDVDAAGTNVTSYAWLVTISDPEGLSTTATLTVSIVDANDNVPYFSAPSYSGSVASDALVGSLVLTVFSTDDDFSSEFRYSEYSIHNTDQFSVDHSGNIIVFETLTTYAGTTDNMYVRVRNPGINSYDTAYINIYIAFPGESGGFFDDPANIAWVTLTGVVAVALLAGLAYLTYKYCYAADAGLKPPQQVAPYETKMPPSRAASRPDSKLSLLSRSTAVTPVTPSDIRVINNNWQAWNTGTPQWEP